MTISHQKRTRRSWSAEEKHALVERWLSSGLSARQFGLKEGVAAENLIRWQRAEPSARSTQQRAVRFTPVQVAEAGSTGAIERGGERAVLEFVLHGGVRLRVLEGADTQILGGLVLALARGM